MRRSLRDDRGPFWTRQSGDLWTLRLFSFARIFLEVRISGKSRLCIYSYRKCFFILLLPPVLRIRVAASDWLISRKLCFNDIRELTLERHEPDHLFASIIFIFLPSILPPSSPSHLPPSPSHLIHKQQRWLAVSILLTEDYNTYSWRPIAIRMIQGQLGFTRPWESALAWIHQLLERALSDSTRRTHWSTWSQSDWRT